MRIVTLHHTGVIHSTMFNGGMEFPFTYHSYIPLGIEKRSSFLPQRWSKSLYDINASRCEMEQSNTSALVVIKNMVASIHTGCRVPGSVTLVSRSLEVGDNVFCGRALKLSA